MLAKDSVNPSLTWLKLFSQMCEFASCCTMESPIHRTSGSPSLASETKRWCIDIHRLSPCTSSTALAVAAEHLRRKKDFVEKSLLFLQTFSLYHSLIRFTRVYAKSHLPGRHAAAAAAAVLAPGDPVAVREEVQHDHDLGQDHVVEVLGQPVQAPPAGRS